jgi:hypothetical protein
MEDIKDTVIYWPSVYVLANSKDDETKNVLVDLDELKWYKDEEGFEESITLEEISKQLQTLGYKGVYRVWTEMGLSGRIYQYGNYDPPVWEEHGTTKGYA